MPASAQPDATSIVGTTRRPRSDQASTGAGGALGGEEEAALSEYLRAFADRDGSAHDFVARHAGSTARAGRALLSLPALTASVTDSVEGRAVRHEFTRFTSRRWLLGLVSVLEIPEHAPDYRTGSSKQTLRRKVRAAQSSGVTWHPVDDPDERRRLLALANMHERLNERELYREAEPDNDDLLSYRLWLVAHAADGDPILLSVTPHDGDWASLRYFRTLSCHPDASTARYLMTEVLVEHLSALGVRYLIDAAVPHWLPNGLRHFQRMLGFRLVRLRFARIRSTRRHPDAVLEHRSAVRH